MVEKFSMMVPGAYGEEPRDVYVYLPTDYEYHLDRYYPVLYMFDGHNVFFDEDASFGKSWGLGEYLDFVDAPLIVAAVECNRDPEGGRMIEYSPFSDEDPEYGYIRGKGRDTMDWFSGEFKNFIDENFRTMSDRNHTFIGGSSMGGHMSLYAILKYNEVYSKAVVLSPTLWFGRKQLKKMIRNAKIDPYTAVFTDYGTFEFEEYEQAYDHYKSLVVSLMDKNVILTSRIVPYGDHSEGSWQKEIPSFMTWLLYDMDLDYYEEEYEDEYETELQFLNGKD